MKYYIPTILALFFVAVVIYGLVLIETADYLPFVIQYQDGERDTLLLPRDHQIGDTILTEGTITSKKAIIIGIVTP